MRIKTAILYKNRLDYERIWSFVFIVGALTFKMVPESFFSLFPCLFHSLTGLPCPTCGITRTALFLIKGDFLKAMQISPSFTLLFMATALYTLYAIFVSVFRTRRIRLAFKSEFGFRAFLLVPFGLVGIEWLLKILIK
jgi:hypothetical protein